MAAIIVTDSLPQYIAGMGGTVDKHGKLNLPESLGTGYLKRIKPSPQLTIMLQQYTLSNALSIKRKEQKDSKNILIFSFRNLKTDKNNLRHSRVGLLSSVQVSTADVNLEIEVAAHIETWNLIIGIEIDFLKELLAECCNNKVIGQMINQKQPFLFEEIISPKIQSVAGEIFQVDAMAILANYLYRIKAEELIYSFLTELLKRQEAPVYPVNHGDIQRIYTIRNKIIEDLETPPQLEALSRMANMSVSKMGRLFRQFFGDSIYNYYQKVRMQQAAVLLREQKLSVSEVGYELGFSNLSHFARLFEKLIGMKPKEYSKSTL